MLCLPAPEITVVYLRSHHIGLVDADNLVITPVEGVVPVAGREVWHAEIQFLHESLEILEVLECLLSRKLTLGCLSR